MNEEGEGELTPDDLLLREAIKRLVDVFCKPAVFYVVPSLGIWIWHCY